MTPTVVVLSTSRRVAPGLLAAAAWTVLRAGSVLTADPAHPQRTALAAAGIDVEVVDAPVLGATGIAALLAARAAGSASATVTWLAGEQGEGGLGTALAALAADGALSLELLAGSWDLPGARLLDAVAVMDRLRSPGGCPWDAEQTHASLAPYLLEESYEAYQALEDGAHGPELCEELGDVLLQVLFHARLAQESRAQAWSVDDVAEGLVAKLVRRHPHVFAASGGTETVLDAAAVERNWDAIKTAEKQRTSAVDGVALGQPALSLAAKLVGRAARAGLPTSLAALPGLGEPAPDADPADLLGRALFGLVTRADQSGVDPEAALRAVARAYADALRGLERSAGA